MRKKHIKKYKEQENEKEIEEAEKREGAPKKRKNIEGEDVAELYDADMDDLDSSDLGENEKKSLKMKNTSKYDPGM